MIGTKPKLNFRLQIYDEDKEKEFKKGKNVKNRSRMLSIYGGDKINLSSIKNIIEEKIYDLGYKTQHKCKFKIVIKNLKDGKSVSVGIYDMNNLNFSLDKFKEELENKINENGDINGKD